MVFELPRSFGINDGKTAVNGSSEVLREDQELLLTSPLGDVQVGKRGAKFLTTGGEYEVAFEDFAFLHVLGYGHYGTVFLARHKPTGTLMALKVF